MDLIIKNTFKKIIFISKPRCGSTSIFNFLYSWDDKIKGTKPLYHTKAKNFINVVGKDFFYKKDSFGIVRDPKDLLSSWFHHHKYGKKISNKVKNFYPESFDSWVMNGYVTHWQNKWERKLKINNPLFQHKWLCKNKKFLVKKVFKLELLKNTRYAGIDFSMIPIENISKHDIQNISTSSKKRIEKDFKIDYELFNY